MGRVGKEALERREVGGEEESLEGEGATEKVWGSLKESTTALLACESTDVSEEMGCDEEESEVGCDEGESKVGCDECDDE